MLVVMNLEHAMQFIEPVNQRNALGEGESLGCA